MAKIFPGDDNPDLVKKRYNFLHYKLSRCKWFGFAD